MNIRNAIRAYFHGAASDRLAASVGLDNALTRKVLSVGLPLQLDMLAAHSSTPEGQTHILETIANLPRFTSVAEALSSHNGIVNLQQAGELLFPILLSNQGDELVQYVTGQVGGSLGSIQKLLYMTLPLMLSLLGQQGLDATNIATVFPQFKGQLDGFQVIEGNDVSGSRSVKNGASASAVVLPNVSSAQTPAPTQTPAQTPATPAQKSTEPAKPAETKPTEPAKPADTKPAESAPAEKTPAAATPKPSEPSKPAETKPAEKTPAAPQAAATTAAVGVAGAAAAGAAMAALSPSSLIDLLKAQFGGDNAKKLGAFAGIDEDKAEKAVQGAIPVVLSGLAQKAKTAEEADALLNKSLEVRDFATEKGELVQLDKTEFLNKAEEKGQGLLAHFYDNFDAIKEKLAGAMGGNGAQAQKLLAVLSPLMLGVVGNRARASKMDGAALSGVFGSLSGKLPALLPSGFSGLGALLGGATAAGVAGAAVAGATSAALSAGSGAGSSGGSATPPPASPPPASPGAAEDHKRAGLSWQLFLALIPLIILAGCLLGPKKDSSTAYGTDDAAGTHGGATGDAAAGDDHDEEGKEGAEDAETDATDATEGSVDGADGDGTDGTDDADASTDDAATDTDDAEATEATSEAEFSITTPEEAAEVPTGSFAVAGVGAVGATYKILRDGTEVGTVNADDEGKWESEINDEDALEGERTYIFEDEKGTEVTRLNVVANADVVVEEADVEGADAEDADAEDADAEDADADAEDTDAEGADTDAETAESDEAQTVVVVVESPAEGDEVPAEGFNVTGQGNPGDTYELLEDGVSVGTFTVAEDGSWTVDVPGTDAGEKNYVVAHVDDGTELASFPLIVQAAVESGTCEKDLTMSLSDNENVTAPYRFGGVGNAETYSIIVKRDDRVIGTKTVELGSNCVWGYLSDPGGASGSVNTITYEVRAEGTAETEAPDTTITLNVKAR